MAISVVSTITHGFPAYYSDWSYGQSPANGIAGDYVIMASISSSSDGHEAFLDLDDGFGYPTYAITNTDIASLTLGSYVVKVKIAKWQAGSLIYTYTGGKGASQIAAFLVRGLHSSNPIDTLGSANGTYNTGNSTLTPNAITTTVNNSYPIMLGFGLNSGSSFPVFPGIAGWTLTSINSDRQQLLIYTSSAIHIRDTSISPAGLYNGVAYQIYTSGAIRMIALKEASSSPKSGRSMVNGLNVGFNGGFN